LQKKFINIELYITIIGEVMQNKIKILEKIKEPEDRLFIAHILDKACKAAKIHKIVCTDFMDPRKKALAERCLKGNIDIGYFFYGGYTGAEREMLFFAPDFIYSDYIYDNDLQIPNIDFLPFINIINIRNKSINKLTHRDYLGALLGLGIKREKLGDIVIGTDFCSVAVTADISEFILYNLEKVGNAKVSVSLSQNGMIEKEEKDAREIKANVAALRIDCIAGAGFGISRSKVAELLKSQKLMLNWETVTSPSKQLKEGDVISIRGKGRIVLEQIGNNTKKNRINITLKKFS